MHKMEETKFEPCFIKSTVNRGDFGQIFTIFINIFIMMNLILAFIWELVPG